MLCNNDEVNIRWINPHTNILFVWLGQRLGLDWQEKGCWLKVKTAVTISSYLFTFSVFLIFSLFVRQSFSFPKNFDFFRLRFVGIWCRYRIEFVATTFLQFIQFLTQPNANYQIWSLPSIPCRTRFILTKFGEINTELEKNKILNLKNRQISEIDQLSSYSAKNYFRGTTKSGK